MLGQTIARNGLDYLPCSLLQPNTANRCTNPSDANWTSPFGFGSWAWEGYLLGAPLSGPGLSMIDATYAYGFARLRGVLPPGTAGGFPGDYYSSGYNAAVGAAGLASVKHRDQGIVGYGFMIANSQSGPLSWWESSSAPDPGSPWVGRHPATGQGSSPHAWGIAGANKVLLDSLVAVRAGRSVSLTLRGASPQGPVQFALPSFIGNIARASTGTVDEATGTVTVKPTVRHVTVTLRTQPRG